ncbi:MAG: ABC transporter ATP-binding protein [Anaerococcus sp.]|nr:ABC transporter ATP-binding protein [Anaerococcus sp.]
MFNDIDLNFSSKEIFKNLNLRIEKGKKYALMGESGSGKSNLLRLIRGDLEPSRGEVLIDNIRVVDLNRDSKAKIFQNLGQDVFIFKETIRKNIFLYDDFSKKQLEEALKKANIYTKIESLKDKDLTVIASGGFDLSGGERQRISLARGLIRNKEIFLFDEDTANLDAYNAGFIEESIRKMDKTVIAIRHRIDGSLKDYDKIIYLDSKKAHVLTYEDFISKFSKKD